MSGCEPSSNAATGLFRYSSIRVGESLREVRAVEWYNIIHGVGTSHRNMPILSTSSSRMDLPASEVGAAWLAHSTAQTMCELMIGRGFARCESTCVNHISRVVHTSSPRSSLSQANGVFLPMDAITSSLESASLQDTSQLLAELQALRLENASLKLRLRQFQGSSG